MELICLGTGAGMPSRERNVAAVALSFAPTSGDWWLFDCGEGTQHRLWDAGLSLHRLTRVFITHLHGDHVYGLPGLLASRSAHGATSTLELTGPPGLGHWLHTTFDASHTRLGYELMIQEIPPAVEGLITVPNEGPWNIRAAWLHHVVPCVGYRLEEPDSPGTLDVQKLRQVGLSPGPRYGALKRGEAVATDDGRVIHPIDVVGPSHPGRVIAILGDTAPCESEQRLAANADLLVHEATFGEDESENAVAFGHSTAIDAAQVAAEANCRRLVLTHISARYKGDLANQLLTEASSRFPHCDIAFDGWRCEIERPKSM